MLALLILTEELLELVGTNPDDWERQKTEQYVGYELGCGHSRRLWDMVGDVFLEVRIQRQEADVKTLPANPGLEPVPYFPVSASRETGGWGCLPSDSKIRFKITN